MWPLRPQVIRAESPELLTFESALANIRLLIKRLETDATDVRDDECRRVFFELSTKLVTNCDAAAQGKFSSIAEICVYSPHLAHEFLPDALQPLYYLGVAEFAGLQTYLRWLSTHEKPYLNLLSPAGRQYLIKLADAVDLLTTAFVEMYNKERLSSPPDSPDQLPVTAIMMDKQSLALRNLIIEQD